MNALKDLYENAIVLNPNTKKARIMATNYAYAKNRSLDDCYYTYSYNKKYAFEQIKNERDKVYGYDLRITGCCCNFFTAAYLVPDEERGIQVMVYHTWMNIYIIPIPNHSCFYDIINREGGCVQ